MKLIDICPFVRFSLEFSFIPSKNCFTAIDNRLFYVSRGKGEIVINDTVYSFSEGTLMIWPAGFKYQFLCDETISLLSINFDYSQKYSDTNQNINPIMIGPEYKFDDLFFKDEIEDCPILNKELIMYNSSEYYNDLKNIVFERSFQQMFYSEFAGNILKKIILKAVRAVSTPEISSAILQKINMVMRYIQNNYSRTISNRELAELVGYHPYYLGRVWLSTQGITLHQYVINYRITMAEQLLISTNDSISSIAQQVGFSCTVSFDDNFKIRKGVSPSVFRKQHRLIRN